MFYFLERFICDKCHKSRRFYCYSCFILSPQLEFHLPTISLPIRIDIVKHVKEIDGKSTATHAVVLAPNETRIYTYPTLPDDWPEDPNKVFFNLENLAFVSLFSKMNLFQVHIQ